MIIFFYQIFICLVRIFVVTLIILYNMFECIDVKISYSIRSNIDDRQKYMYRICLNTLSLVAFDSMGLLDMMFVVAAPQLTTEHPNFDMIKD